VFELRKTLPGALISEKTRKVPNRAGNVTLKLLTHQPKTKLTGNRLLENAIGAERPQHAIQCWGERPGFVRERLRRI